MDISLSAGCSWWPAQQDELVALVDEIACLKHVGIPLVEGLREVAQDHPKRLSQIALWVAERLEQGIELSDALSVLSPKVREVSLPNFALSRRF